MVLDQIYDGRHHVWLVMMDVMPTRLGDDQTPLTRESGEFLLEGATKLLSLPPLQGRPRWWHLILPQGAAAGHHDESPWDRWRLLPHLPEHPLDVEPFRTNRTYTCALGSLRWSE